MKISDQIAAVSSMSKSELLDYVIANPHYLVDPFYNQLAEAIRQRRQQLEAPSPNSNRSGGRMRF